MSAEKSLFSQVELYDIEEIAQIAGVSDATIRRCIREGRLPPQRLGRKWKVSRESALAFFGGGNGNSNEPHAMGRGRRAAPKGKRHSGHSRKAPTEAITKSQNSTHRAPIEQEVIANPGRAGAQLLFLKPEDLDRLVSALAIHVERFERVSERREIELKDLISRLASENESLKNEMRQLREEQRELVRKTAEKILIELNSPERQETERFRFRWIQEQLRLLTNSSIPKGEDRSRRKRPWWRFSK